MASLGNALGDDVLRRAFADASLEHVLKPVIGIEQFSTMPDGPITRPQARPSAGARRRGRRTSRRSRRQR